MSLLIIESVRVRLIHRLIHQTSVFANTQTDPAATAAVSTSTEKFKRKEKAKQNKTMFRMIFSHDQITKASISIHPATAVPTASATVTTVRHWLLFAVLASTGGLRI